MTPRFPILTLFWAFFTAVALPCHGAGERTVAVGRFAQPTLTGVGTLCNFNHNIVVERGFKLLYLAPQRKGERWGAPVFAGFVSLLVNGKTQAHTLISTRAMGQGTRTLLAAPTLGRYAKEYAGNFGRARVICEDAIGNPVVRFSAEVAAKDRPATAEWLITGWEWDKQPVPTHWEWWGRGGRSVIRPHADVGAASRGDSLRLQLPPGDGFLLAWNDGQPYTLALLPAARPQEVRVSPTGVTLRFAASAIARGKKGALPDLYLACLDAHPADSLLRILPALAQPNEELVAEFGASGGESRKLSRNGEGTGRDGTRPLRSTLAAVGVGLLADPLSAAVAPRPWISYGRSGRGRQQFIPAPPPFGARVKASAVQDTPLGRVAFVAGRAVKVGLAIPPNLEHLVADFPPLPPDEKAAVEADVKAILDHQSPDGTFTFSLGRPFYDGQTAGVLVQLAPLLDEPLRGRTIAAVRKTLDYWWGRLMTDSRTGVVVFPEPVMPSAVVDYPEIAAAILYPTAAYAQLVDRDYARQIWPKAAALAATLPRAYDITGSAWAHAGPEYVHILTESTVGGYLAYASLYHLARLAGQNAAGQFRERACWAFAAMDLYHWREEYGRGGILSQIFGDGLFVEPALAWDYTMFTWFSWCPLWSLPRDDRYHVWEVLRQQRWWLYFRDSHQLAYDFSHFMALVRFGDPAEGLAHWDEILAHEATFDNFDTVALYRPLARVWKEVPRKR